MEAELIFTVDQQTVAIVQRFGKHHRIAEPGLHFMLPIADRVVSRLDMRVQQMTVRAETKTKDNVFVHMTVAVQFQIQKPYDAFYRLSNPSAQIESFVYDVVRARVPLMTLDTAFEAKDDIADAVRSELPHSPSGMSDIFTQVRDAVIVGSEANKTL